MNGPDFLIPIFFFLSTAAVIIIYFTVRHRERMTIIEKGMTSEDIKALYARDVAKRTDPLSSLKWGILFVFAGLAFLIANYLDQMYHLEEQVYFGMTFLFVGIGLVIYYMLALKRASHQ